MPQKRDKNMILDKKYLFLEPFQNLALLAEDDRRTVENSTKPKFKLTNCRTKYNWNTKRNTPKCIRQLFQLLRIVKRGRGHNWKYERRTPKLVSATFRDRCRTNLLASFQNWIQSGILSVFWFPAKKKHIFSGKILFGGAIEGYRGVEEQSI